MIGGTGEKIAGLEGSGGLNSREEQAIHRDNSPPKERGRPAKAVSVDEEPKPAESSMDRPAGGVLPPIIGSAHKKTKSSGVTGPVIKNTSGIIDEGEHSLQQGNRSPESPQSAARIEPSRPAISPNGVQDEPRDHSHREHSHLDSARRSYSRRLGTKAEIPNARPEARSGLDLMYSPDINASRARSVNKSLVDRSQTAFTSNVRPLKVKNGYDDKDTLICRFCGGESCKHEDYKTIKNPAIPGLNSNWINEDIVASQRPNARLLKEHNSIEFMKKAGFGIVVNLQEPGEHAKCGDGIDNRWGFSYSSEMFNQSRSWCHPDGISTFHFHWEDLKTVELSHLLKIVKILDSHMEIRKEKPKVFVHCHAGRGRTGMVICSLLIYRYGMDGAESVALFKKKREGKCLDNKQQVGAILDFEKYILKLAKTFGDDLTLDGIVSDQNKLYSIDSNSFQHNVPKVVVQIIDRLCVLREEDRVTSSAILTAFLNPDSEGVVWSAVGAEEEQLKELKRLANARSKTAIKNVTDARFLIQLLLDFFEELDQPAIDRTFYRQFDDVFGDPAKLRSFFNGKDPRMISFHENTYHTLAFIAKFMNLILGKNPDQGRQMMVRHAILRLSIALNKNGKLYSQYFFSRTLLTNLPAVSDLSLTDKLTGLLFQWSMEYEEMQRQKFIALRSPIPGLHHKILQQIGRVDFGQSDKFDSKLLQKKDLAAANRKGPGYASVLSGLSSVEQSPSSRHNNTLHLELREAHAISEEDDQESQEEFDATLFDSLPEDIKNFIPVFMEMAYEEQNNIIKELNRMRKPQV